MYFLRCVCCVAALLAVEVRADSMCDKYGQDLRTLAGDESAVTKPAMSHKRGALDERPVFEMGCAMMMQPSGSEAMIVVHRRSDLGLPEWTSSNAVRARRELYANPQLRKLQLAEPELGAEGFSLLLPSTDISKASSILVMGHSDSLAVEVYMLRGYRAAWTFTEAHLVRMRKLARDAILSER